MGSAAPTFPGSQATCERYIYRLSKPISLDYVVHDCSTQLLVCLMISAIAQTLANILSGGTSLIDKEQIYFNHPATEENICPCLNLYCYDLREERTDLQGNHSCSAIDRDGRSPPRQWVEVSFLISAWDFTAFGEQQLLSEALKLLSHYHSLPEEVLVPVLRGHGNIPIHVFFKELTDAVALWRALGVPMRPAIHITVTAPFYSIPPQSPGERHITC